MGRAQDADVQRILGQYKRLVLLGKAKLPFAEARRLVGPDTAFHLYFRHAAPPAPRRAKRRRTRERDGAQGALTVPGGRD